MGIPIQKTDQYNNIHKYVIFMSSTKNLKKI